MVIVAMVFMQVFLVAYRAESYVGMAIAVGAFLLFASWYKRRWHSKSAPNAKAKATIANHDS
jgi:hypothetical protein